MCGIVGIIKKDWTTSLNYSAEKAFTQMLYANAVRGTDGTGYFYYNNTKKEVLYQKMGLPSYEAIPKMADLKQLAGKARWIVGHNRKATFGKNNQENSHPFTTKGVTLVHNGTLSNAAKLEELVGAEVEVDSAVIPHVLNKFGHKKGLEELQGAYALVWYNQTTEKLSFCRNDERPLYLLETKDYYVLSSEDKLAEWVLDRNDIAVLKITEVTPGIVYSIFVNKLNKLIISKTKFSPHVKSIHKNYTPTDYGDYYQKQIPFIPQKENSLERHQFQKRYQVGDKLPVRVTKVSTYGSNNTVEAVTIEKPIRKVMIYTQGLPLELHSAAFLDCTPTSVVWGPYPNPTLYAKMAAQATGITYSNNGKVITPIIAKELDMFPCEVCSSTELYDYKDCFVDFDKDELRYTYECPICTQQQKAYDSMEIAA